MYAYIFCIFYLIFLIILVLGEEILRSGFIQSTCQVSLYSHVLYHLKLKTYIYILKSQLSIFFWLAISHGYNVTLDSLSQF